MGILARLANVLTAHQEHDVALYKFLRNQANEQRDDYIRRASMLDTEYYRKHGEHKHAHCVQWRNWHETANALEEPEPSKHCDHDYCWGRKTSSH